MSQSPFATLRVALVGPFPPRAGELGEQAELLARLLAAEGAQVLRLSTDVPRVRAWRGIGLHLLPFVQVAQLLARLLTALPRCDVVHIYAASGWGFWLPALLALPLAKLARRRVVISYHGGLARAFSTRRWSWLLPLLRRADALAAPSAYGQALWQRDGLQVAWLPPLLDAAAPPIAERAGWPPLLLWCDELTERADPRTALEALALLRTAVPDARLLLAGSGPLAAQVQHWAAELQVAQAVAYRAALSPTQRRTALVTASVFWRSAQEDNLPQVLLEAAAAGTAIVATRVGGVPELVDDGVDGLLVAAGDAAALAQATARVLARPFLAASLTANARLSAERFTWPQVRNGLAQLYGMTPPDAVSDTAPDDLPARTEFLWSDPHRPMTGKG
ncbi:MAG: glycosyltransferase [Caldilineales bacterium]